MFFQILGVGQKRLLQYYMANNYDCVEKLLLIFSSLAMVESTENGTGVPSSSSC